MTQRSSFVLQMYICFNYQLSAPWLLIICKKLKKKLLWLDHLHLRTFGPKRLTEFNSYIHTPMAMAAMQGADQHIKSSLGFIILPKPTSTCRPGESNQRPSNNKTLSLPLRLIIGFVFAADPSLLLSVLFTLLLYCCSVCVSVSVHVRVWVCFWLCAGQTCWLACSAWLLTQYWSEGGEEPFLSRLLNAISLSTNLPLPLWTSV